MKVERFGECSLDSYLDVRVSDLERLTSDSIKRAQLHRLIADYREVAGGDPPRRGYVRIWATDAVDYLRHFLRLFCVAQGVAAWDPDADHGPEDGPEAEIQITGVRALELIIELVFPQRAPTLSTPRPL